MDILLCIAMALPIAIALAMLGGVSGRAIALHTPGRPAQLASLVLAVPVLAGSIRCAAWRPYTRSRTPS